jgi:hypothetical protein
MAWYDSLISPFMDDKGGYDIEKIINTGSLAATVGSQAADLFGLSDNRQQPSGYQGGIPSYTANRTQVPNTYDPARRPGSGGQRYFTDMSYSGGDPSTEAAGLEALNRANPAKQTRNYGPPPPAQTLAAGGIASLQEGRSITGNTDGMADEVPAVIEGEQPAALSDGEFVIPADVVSHLGNGNTDAGVKVLEDMMGRVRKTRTGTEVQAKEIAPEEFLPV